jgi:hypothetical protein
MEDMPKTSIVRFLILLPLAARPFFVQLAMIHQNELLIGYFLTLLPLATRSLFVQSVVTQQHWPSTVFYQSCCQ